MARPTSRATLLFVVACPCRAARARAHTQPRARGNTASQVKSTRAAFVASGALLPGPSAAIAPCAIRRYNAIQYNLVQACVKGPLLYCIIRQGVSACTRSQVSFCRLLHYTELVSGHSTFRQSRWLVAIDVVNYLKEVQMRAHSCRPPRPRADSSAESQSKRDKIRPLAVRLGCFVPLRLTAIRS